MNKDLIKQRFARNIESYSKNAVVQQRMADRLFSKILSNNFENILEIGCGTGFLTQIIDKNLDFKSYTAVDIVPECAEFIKKINSDINFVSQDVEEFIKNNDKKFDLIVSNASLQWVENFEAVIDSLVSKLNNDGKLLFSTFGVENYREIEFVTGNKLKYYSVNELKDMFSDYSKCDIEEEIHIISFSTPKDVLKHIHYTGVNAIESKTWTKKDIKEFESGYNNFCSNRVTLTYNPVYVKIEI